MAKLTDQTANGTSFHHSTITASAKELIAALGEPQCQSNNGEDKVNLEWTCETENGKVFTIYDWKEYREISMHEMITWHVGGHSRYDTIIAVDELQTILK